MIIRKPYAFLIKHFRRIHIFVLLLCGYVYYKCMQTRSFVADFLELGTYDAYNEPITNYASVLAIIFMIIIVIASVLLLIVLRHKKKPWKLYGVFVFTYIYLLIVFVLTISLFASYSDTSGTTGIRAVGDLLFMGTFPQYVVIIILLIRVFGVDLNKFDFKSDQEYLELSAEDREEIEINVNIDKESFRRTFKRLKRNIGYVYQEHKLIVHSIVVLVVVVSVVSIYRYVFIIHRSYREGDNIQSSGYSIVIHHSYFTNKDYHGEVISKDSNFVVLDLTLTNNVERRDVNFNRFHIMNTTENYAQTYRTYGTEFQDLGKTYDKLTLNNGQSQRFIMVYKVDKKLDPSKYVLYYQELDNNQPYLRKIKLKMEDLTDVDKQKEKKLQELEMIDVGDKEYSFSIEEYRLVNQTTYNNRVCSSNNNCYSSSNVLRARNGKLILEVFFSSGMFSGKDFVDFSEEYGKIIYIDNKGKVQEISIKDAVNRSYDGNYMYLEVPEELQNASLIRLVYTVRNKEYIYRLK